ncbi:hypothetical protein BB561_000458 [Smittium simulii]|uniref:Uncharacterized protein n=1 Tax=Smittium simulii TaxID=133385 RepID=A0A2T9YZ40_9FUNG|nr:hypothetical protein BB561_000458 [Smittium simulii]
MPGVSQSAAFEHKKTKKNKNKKVQKKMRNYVKNKMVRLRQELSLTGLNIKTACPYKNRCDIWVSGCTRWAKKYNGNINKIKNTIKTLNNRIQKNDKSQISKWIAATEAGTSCNWVGLELVYPELKTHINYVLKIQNGTYWAARRYAKSGFIEKRFIEECPFCRNIAPETIEHMLLELALPPKDEPFVPVALDAPVKNPGLPPAGQAKPSNPAISSTSGEGNFKNIAPEKIELMLLECSRWQALRADTLAQYINIYRAQVATKPPILPASISMRLVGKLLGEELKLSKCPFCRNIAPETIEHMLLECSRWQALRADTLAQYINIYRAQVATKPPILPASISMRLVGKLLGEELKLSSTRIRKDPTVLCVKTTLATAKFLNAIALPRYLMLYSIRLAPIPPNQCPPGSDKKCSCRWAQFTGNLNAAIEYVETFFREIEANALGFMKQTNLRRRLDYKLTATQNPAHKIWSKSLTIILAHTDLKIPNFVELKNKNITPAYRSFLYISTY